MDSGGSKRLGALLLGFVVAITLVMGIVLVTRPAPQAVDPPKPEASATPTGVVVQVAPTPPPTTTPVPAEAPRSSFGGIVVSQATGEPVAGAEVSFPETRIRASYDPFVPDPIPDDRKAISDAAGQFRLPKPLAEPQAARAWTGAKLTAPGFASVLVVGLDWDALKSGTARFELAPAGIVEGRVVDQNDNPVAGADVLAAEAGTRLQRITDARMVSMAALEPTKTDQDGRFRFERGPKEATLRFMARADGFSGTAVMKDLPSTDEIVIKLEKGGAPIVGKVLNADGTPVAGAIIAASMVLRDAGSIQIAGTGFVSPARSAQDGTFRIEGLKPGEWQIAARRDESLQGESANAMVVVTETREQNVELKFPEPLYLNVTVIDGENKLPMSGVQLIPFRQFPGMGDQAPSTDVVYTDGEGKARVAVRLQTSVNSSWGTLTVVPPPGYIMEDSNGEANTLNFWQAKSGSEQAQTIVLRRGRTARLQFYDVDTTTPLRTTQFRLRGLDGRGFQNQTTDDKGRATVTLTMDTTYAVELEAISGWARDTIPAKVDDPAKEQVVTLSKYSTLKGRVLDVEGNPVEGATLQVTEMAADETAPSRTFRMSPNADFKTDDRGDFELNRTVGLRVSVTANPPKDSTLTASEATIVDLVAGETREGIELKLGSGATLTVTVQDDAGNPIEDANANWSQTAGGENYYGNPNDNRKAITDAKGQFKIAGLSEKSVVRYMNVSKQGYRSAYRNELRLLEGDVTIVLQRDADLTVAAVDETTGRPITRYDYLVYQTAWDQWSHDGKPVRVEDEAGIAELKVSPGTGKRIVVAEVDAEGKYTGRKGAATFSVPPPGQPRQVLVPVGPGVTIKGIVVNAGEEEEPIEGAVVKQIDRRWGDRATVASIFTVPDVTTDSKGRFEIPDLQEGTYELVATVGEVTTPEAVTVEIGRDKTPPEEVKIVFSRGGSIQVTAIGKDKKPLSGARIQAYPEGRGRNSFGGTTDAEGKHLMEGVTAGKYTVMLSTSDGLMNSTTSVEVANGEVTPAEFDFSKMVELTGKLTVDGKPWLGRGEPYFGASPVGESRSSWTSLAPTGTGSYKLNALPGSYMLRMSANSMAVPTAVRFELTAEPAKQEKDLEVITTALDVAVVMPDGERFRQGSLSFNGKNGETVDEAISTVQVEGERRRIEFFAAGTYQVRYRSYQDNFEGESEWVTVKPGAENVIVIFAKKADKTLNPIARVQQQLTNLGYDPGPVDGLMGPMTRNAIRSFQGDQELPVNGLHDDTQTTSRLDQLAPLPTASP
ncbi:hypothetical protein GC173_02230 [bacterium]|nr:hypothetical protein [bacterium]